MKDYKSKYKNVRQMTDEELRRKLDYSVGDEVLFIAFPYIGTWGKISAISVSSGGRFLVYQVCMESESGIEFVNARSDQIKFLGHTDDDY